MYSGLIDSHFHLPCIHQRGIDASALLSGLFSNGFSGGISICLSEEDLLFSMERTRPYPGIRTAMGFGPWEFQDRTPQVPDLIAELDRLLSKYRYSFLGEFGLDYHWEYGTHALQKQLVEAELDFAARRSLPVIIHNRDASADILDILLKSDNPHSGIIHCFSSDRHTAFRLLDHGYYLSFAGNITYKHTEELSEVIKAIPRDRILLETDSPYLSPSHHRGQTNTPMNMPEIYGFCSSLLKMDIADLSARIRQNFTTLLTHCPEGI